MKISSIGCRFGRHDFVMKDISLMQDEARRVCTKCHLMQYGYEDMYCSINRITVKPKEDKPNKFDLLPDNLKLFLKHGVR